MSDKAGQRKAILLCLLHDLLEQSQRIGLVESAIAQMGVVPIPQLELATSVCGLDIDARCGQSLDVLVTALGIDGVDGLLSQLQAIFDEGNRDFVLLIGLLKKAQM